MATALAQPVVDSGGVTGATQTATYGANVTAGNTLVALVAYSAITGTVQVSDSLNGATNFWTQQSLHQARARAIGVYTFPGTLGGAKPVVTATVSASQSQLQVIIFELIGFCNIDAGAILATDGAAATTASIGPITTTGTADFLLSFIMGGTGPAGTSGWTFTACTSPANRAYEYIASQPAGAYTATYTFASSTWNGVVMAFVVAPQQAAAAITAGATVTANAVKLTAGPPLAVVGSYSVAVNDSTWAVNTNGIAQVSGAVAINASAVVTPTAKVFRFSADAITAKATVTATAKVIRNAVDPIAAKATVTPTAKVIHNAAAAITAGAVVTANAPVTHKAADAISPSALVTANAVVSHRGTDAITGPHATVTATAKVIHNAVTAIAGAATVTAGATKAGTGAIVAITAKASVTANAPIIHKAAATITAKATVTANAPVVHKAADAIAAHATVTPNANKAGTGPNVVVTAKATLTVNAAVIRPAAVAITAQAAMTPHLASLPPKATVAAGATLLVNGCVKYVGTVPITAAANVYPGATKISTGAGTVVPIAPTIWASLIPPLPILDDIANLPTMQLQAYCMVYELPTISISPDDMRDNLKRVRQIYQGDTSQLTDTDRRTLFDSWGIEGDWATAPSDDIAVVLVGYALSLAMRYNAVGYCRSPLSVTAKNPTVTLNSTGECDINVEVEAAETAGLPLTGTGTCNLTLTTSVYQPRYFDLPNSNTPADPAALTGWLASGISIRTNWSQLQPTAPAGGAPTSNPNDASYNWSFIDSELARAQAATPPRTVSLRIIPQAGNMAPWLAGLGAQIYTDTGNNKVWIWYDPIAQPYFIAMMQAMANRYGNNPAVEWVAVTGANSTSGDWGVPSGVASWNLLSSQATINCPPYGSSMTVIPVANSTVRVGWLTFINAFGWFMTTAATGPAGNRSTVTLQNLGIAGNASSGVIGTGKQMQVKDINNLTSPVYNYTSAKLISFVENVVQVLAQGFPMARVYLACGRNGNLDPTSGGVLPTTADPDYVCAQICNDMFAVHPNQFQMGKNQFAAAQTPVYPPPATGSNFSIFVRAPAKVLRGGQALWYCFGDPTYQMNGFVPAPPMPVLAQSVATMKTYHPIHYEIYEQDLKAIQQTPGYVQP